MLHAAGYGVMIFGLVFGVVISRTGFHWWSVPIATLAGGIGASSGWIFGEMIGGTWKRFMVDGTSTPYREQYSYQQSLVMQGRVDDALESFEAVIAENPDEIDPRVKAAELYVREKANHQRAAELFREVQRIAAVTPGQDIYVTNRLVDLLTGPLADPGRALVELRRLVERYPRTPAAQHARDALHALKARVTAT
jgi:tetratricopeptide (TPR) repeat protein